MRCTAGWFVFAKGTHMKHMSTMTCAQPNLPPISLAQGAKQKGRELGRRMGFCVTGYQHVEYRTTQKISRTRIVLFTGYQP